MLLVDNGVFGTLWHVRPCPRPCVVSSPGRRPLLQGAIPWDPSTLDRAIRAGAGAGQAKGAKANSKAEDGPPMLAVLDCANFEAMLIPQATFFKG